MRTATLLLVSRVFAVPPHLLNMVSVTMGNQVETHAKEEREKTKVLCPLQLAKILKT